MAVENTELTHPGTAASEDRDGKASWSDVDNIKAIADYATCDVVAATYSDWLRASNFGFQIPTGSTINGIEVRVRRKGELGVLRDSALYLVDANGDNDGDNKADTETFWPTSAASATYGSSSDTWGTDAVPFHINNSNFGIRLSAHNNDLSTRTASVAQVYIRVYYTPQATDWKTPAHCTTQTRTGSAVAWTNYSRAETSDNYYAEATVPTSSYTDWLRVDQFGFDSDDFPLTTVIAGFDIKIERKAGITSNLYDSAIHLRTSAGQHSANHAVATKWGTTDTEVVYRYLGPMGGDLSDTTKIQDGEFGIDLSVACDADAETIAYVDCISVRVHYAGEVSLLTETLQDYCNTDDNGQRSAYSVYWKAQSFTPSESYKVTSVKLRLFRERSPGTIDVGIYATDGSGHPTGSALCSGTTDGDTLPTGSPYEWRQITLGAGYQLTSGIKCAIVVSAPSGSFFNWVRWRSVSPSGYANGNMLYSADSGSSWTSQADYDGMFEVWGQVGGVTDGFLLMETGDYLLLETGDKILLETIGGAAYFRIITLNLSLSPSISRLAAHPRSITSNLSLSPSLTRTKGFVRTITSNLTLAATIGRVVTFARSITSNLTLNPTVSRVVAWTRDITSNLTLNPIITIRRVVDYLITIVANLSLSPSITRTRTVTRAITTNLSLSPTVSRVVAWTRDITSNLTLSPTITRTVGFAKTITANLSLAASVVRNTTYTRVTTSNLTLSLTIVITAVGRFLKILVATGNVYVVKGIESSVYKMKTVAGNVNIISVASGVVHNVKTFAGRVYHMIIKEVR